VERMHGLSSIRRSAMYFLIPLQHSEDTELSQSGKPISHISHRGHIGVCPFSGRFCDRVVGCNACIVTQM
jgi:hypothetical protein